MSETSETRHTPGPWMVDPISDAVVSRLSTDPDGRRPTHWIAECDLQDDAQENHANARLIAAAPELLELVRYLVACCEQAATGVTRIGAQRDVERLVGTIAGAHLNLGMNIESISEQARALVAKAEGRS